MIPHSCRSSDAPGAASSHAAGAGLDPSTPRRRPPPSRSTTSRLAVATPSPSASGSTPARAAGTSPPARSPTPSGCRPRSSARSARRAAGRAGCAPPAPARSTMEGSATRSARGDGRAARRRHRAPALRRRPRPRAARGASTPGSLVTMRHQGAPHDSFEPMPLRVAAAPAAKRAANLARFRRREVAA